MAFASYLGDFDVDAETNRVLDVALEMTRAALDSSSHGGTRAASGELTARKP
jgi:hypothetical protein